MEQGSIISDFTVKSAKKDNTVISGYASVFGVIDNHNDVIEKGAFKTVCAHKVKLLWQHDTTKPIGIIKFLKEDEYGLQFEAEINNGTNVGREASELVKQGAVDSLSIGFLIKSSDYNKKGSRVICDLDLMEISIVTFPANIHASITQIKSDDLICATQDEEKLNELSKLIKQIANY
jgi:HK97 family phage prohead protease